MFWKTRRPKEANGQARLRASDETVLSIMEGKKLAVDRGWAMATFSQVVMDKQLLDQSKLTTLMMDPTGVPKSRGWYRINRETGEITPTSKNIIYNKNVDWHERLLVYSFATEASRRGRSLSLYMDYLNHDSRWLVADTYIRRGSGARVALVDTDHKSTANMLENATLLRS
jgi:hypothetical protein